MRSYAYCLTLKRLMLPGRDWSLYSPVYFVSADRRASSQAKNFRGVTAKPWRASRNSGLAVESLAAFANAGSAAAHLLRKQNFFVWMKVHLLKRFRKPTSGYKKAKNNSRKRVLNNPTCQHQSYQGDGISYLVWLTLIFQVEGGDFLS